MATNIQRVTVVGCGTMGNGIAHTFAQFGFDVFLTDLNADALAKAIKTIEGNLSRQVTKGSLTEEQAKATMARIQTGTDLNQAGKDADLVIEAVTENISVKESIFITLDSVCKPHTILASNTSSISITKIAAATKRPSQVIGMHFMNPVPVMKLVEVIRGYHTSDDVTALVMETSKRLDKVPVEANDYPGFVSNRILMPMINEAIWTLHEGVAGVEEIDTVMRLGMSHPMGPLRLADFIGLDVCKFILDVLHQGFGNPKYAPCPLLVNMVTAGYLGAKTGEGFYQYTPGSKDMVVSSKFKK